MKEKIHKLKVEIIETMNLDMRVEDIDDDSPIFGEGLALDSIDALELIVMIEKIYKLKITDAEEAKIIFKSVRSLAEYIDQKTK